LRGFDIVWLLAREAPGGQPMTSTKRFQSPDNNKQIERIQKRFEDWRKSQKPRTRIPKRLWESAVQVARGCGVNRTAKALHLDYNDLKKRLKASRGIQESAPAFIELLPAVTPSTPECIIECENGNGAKMRVHIKGIEAPDLNALSSAFWRGKR
jgi:hypothetical protein